MLPFIATLVLRRENNKCVSNHLFLSKSASQRQSRCCCCHQVSKSKMSINREENGTGKSKTYSSLTSSSFPANLANSSIASSMQTVESTSKHTASADLRMVLARRALVVLGFMTGVSFVVVSCQVCEGTKSSRRRRKRRRR